MRYNLYVLLCHICTAGRRPTAGLIFGVFYIILISGILYGYCDGISGGIWGPSVVHWQILIRTLTHHPQSLILSGL